MCLLIIVCVAPTAAANDFVVTLLGTGSPIPAPDRFGNATLVEVGGKTLLFDAGRGTTIRLWQKKVPLGSIDAHFLTHLHSDHVNGLSDLWLTGWIQAPFGGREEPFVVYGPRGTRKMMAHLWQAFSEDIRIRVADEGNSLSGIRIHTHQFCRGGVIYEDDGVVVSVFEVDHGDLVKPAYGYKVSYNGHSVVISGDTRYNENVVAASHEADLLIHEVAMIPQTLLDNYPVFQAVYDHHITPEEAGELFTVTRPKLAVYSHIVFSGMPPAGIPLPTVDELVAATRTTYNGPLVVGADLMSFVITDTGVTVLPPSTVGPPPSGPPVQ
ncbi:MAG: MBL fold metallo-hydrolase [Deltaproteobacteria bacterium]|nr:MBL fold metallo-hydrolase [Deltaproteobacteria bacterium]